MNLFRKRNHHAAGLLEDAPGPSPWYLGPKGPRIESRQGTLVWEYLEANESMASASLLKNHLGAVLGLVGSYCRVIPMPRHQFLVWYERFVKRERDGRIPGGNVPEGAVEMRVFDSDALSPVAQPDQAREEMKQRGLPFVFGSSEVATASIPQHLGVGTHHVPFPDAFHVIDEILVLAHIGAASDTESDIPGLRLCLFIVHPAKDTVEIIPQDWFNKGDFDFGYQWPTRVARDPETGRIVGEGIRVRSFELDESNRDIARWLSQSV